MNDTKKENANEVASLPLMDSTTMYFTNNDNQLCKWDGNKIILYDAKNTNDIKEVKPIEQQDIEKSYEDSKLSPTMSVEPITFGTDMRILSKIELKNKV
jgi:hypothetical protein